MGAIGRIAPGLALIDLHDSFVRKATKGISFQIPIGLVSIDGVMNPIARDPGSHDAFVEAADGMTDDFHAAGAGSLLHVVELDDLTFIKTGAEVFDHSDLGSQGDRVDVAVRLCNHKGGDFQRLVAGGDDVSVVHVLYN